MTTEILHKKVDRYLCGVSRPAETRQIQNWLSCTKNGEVEVTEEDKLLIASEILLEVKEFTAYPLFYPIEQPWWKKFTAMF